MNSQREHKSIDLARLCPKESYEPQQQSGLKTRKKHKSAFLDNLFLILESNKFSELICWSQDGTFFSILQPERFAIEVLPRFYKHSKLSSFIRQLNMYEFRKLCRVTDICGEMSYQHSFFRRNRKDLLEKVIRMKKSQPNKEEHNISKSSSEEINPPLEPKKKIVKFSDTDPIERDNEISNNEQIDQNVEEELNRMEEIAEYMIKKYGYISEDPRKAFSRTGEQIYEEFRLFNKELYKLLEFDKIDQY